MQLLHCNAARYGAWPSPGRQITRVVSRAPLVRANKEDGGTVDPDSNKTQEELVDILNLEVAKAKVREDISKDLEQRKESLRKIGEEVSVHKSLACMPACGVSSCTPKHHRHLLCQSFLICSWHNQIH